MIGKGLVDITFELSLEGEVGVCGQIGNIETLALKEFITKHWGLDPQQYD